MTTATTTAVATHVYEIDKAHSEATFQVRHLLTKVRGQFADFDGAVAFDPDAPEAGSVRFTIQAASINTKDGQRDGHLKSPDFFDVEKYPTLTSKSTRVEKVQAATDFCFSFDFDDWSRLARDDPSAFEARRLALIEEFLCQFPEPEQ